MALRRMRDEETGQVYDLDVDLEEDPTTPPASAPPPSDKRWAEMRRDAEAGKRAQRELAFLRAGIDPAKDPRFGDFMAVYDGDLAEARIKEAAVARGYLPDPAAPVDPTPEQAAATAADAAITAAGSGALPHQVPGQQQLTEAFAAGGQDAMLAKAKELGLTVDPSYATPGDAGPGGWGAAT